MVFFAVYFPFRAKFLEKNGYFVYIHVVMVVVALLLACVPVAATFATGGFIVARFPTVNCFANNVDVTFYALEFPLSLMLATGLSLIVLIFYKVFGVIRKQIKEKVGCVICSNIGTAVHNSMYMDVANLVPKLNDPQCSILHVYIV